jgi:hypothetical protein
MQGMAAPQAGMAGMEAAKNDAGQAGVAAPQAGMAGMEAKK